MFYWRWSPPLWHFPVQEHVEVSCVWTFIHLQKFRCLFAACSKRVMGHHDLPLVLSQTRSQTEQHSRVCGCWGWLLGWSTHMLHSNRHACAAPTVPFADECTCLCVATAREQFTAAVAGGPLLLHNCGRVVVQAGQGACVAVCVAVIIRLSVLVCPGAPWMMTSLASDCH